MEAVGFSSDQAKAITEVVEEGIQRGFERFAEVLDKKIGAMEAKFDSKFNALEAKFDSKFNALEAKFSEVELRLKLEIQTARGDMLQDQRDLMLRYTALVSLVIIVTGAVVKFL